LGVLNTASLGQQAYQEIRRRILTLHYAPGARLQVDEIAQDLAVSPSPVKEALKLLEAEGLVEIRARRGTMVRQFTARDVVDVYEMRELIEGGAAAKAIATGAVTPAALAALRGALARLEAVTVADGFSDVDEGVRADWAFHARIVALTGNAMLTECHDRLLGQAIVIRNFSMYTRRAQATLTEHRAILAALAAGDAARARAVSAAHLAATRDAIVAAMGTGPLAGPGPGSRPALRPAPAAARATQRPAKDQPMKVKP
jgi:DNA-binding GntR family transcriptional regulator